jgi:hypothetical protein
MLLSFLQKKWYPIQVVIIKRYANTLKIEFDRGGVFPKEIKTENGVIKTEVLKLRKSKVEIPAPDIKFYHDVDNERVLYLFQYERNVFFPCSITNEKISYFVPEVVVDEKGNKIIRMKEIELFTPKLNVEEIEEKTWSYWLASRIELANRMFRKISFWERWGGLIMITLMLIFGVMIFISAFQQYSNIIGQASQSLKDVADALNKVADKLVQASQQNVTAPITPPKPPY